MMLNDAFGLLSPFLAPLLLDEFLDETLQGGFRKIGVNQLGSRLTLLGTDPEKLLLEAFHLAPKLTFHSANPTGPPPSLNSIGNAATFRQLVYEFHSRNYSVRFPELRAISRPLDELARAFEMVLHQPVTTSAFWSRGGMRSPVHFDDHDLIVVQLRGAKRWYVSEKPSELNNAWEGIPSAAAPELGKYFTVDVIPGEVLYLPRGTLHSVESETESLHVAIGFTPMTLRQAVIAALDQLSDLDKNFRVTVGGRIAEQLGKGGIEGLIPAVVTATERLSAACRAPGFLSAALQRRSARVVGALKPLAAPDAAPDIDLDTLLTHAPLAFCHLTANAEKIDFSYPGGHIYVHVGAADAIVFMVNTPRFRIRDIPGGIDDAVRVSLAARLIQIGFLTTVGL